jgi:hypothetical protein
LDFGPGVFQGDGAVKDELAGRAVRIDSTLLERLFGVLLLITAVKMMLAK